MAVVGPAIVSRKVVARRVVASEFVSFESASDSCVDWCVAIRAPPLLFGSVSARAAVPGDAAVTFVTISVA